MKASERREESAGDNLLGEMRKVQQKAWALLARMEADGDLRGAIVANREVRECVEGLGKMLNQVAESGLKEPETIRVEMIHMCTCGAPGAY